MLKKIVLEAQNTCLNIIKKYCLLQCYSVWRCSPLNACVSYWQCLEAILTKSEVKSSPFCVSGFSSYKILQWHKMTLEHMVFQNTINTKSWDLGCQLPDILKKTIQRSWLILRKIFVHLHYCMWKYFIFFLPWWRTIK